MGLQMRLLSKQYFIKLIMEKIHLGGSFFVVNTTFLALFLSIIIYLKLFSHSSSYSVKCEYKKVTGIECVTCGYTRAFSKYLQGDFKEGMSLNRSSFIYFICLSYLFIVRLFWIVFTMTIQKTKFSKRTILLDSLISFFVITLATFFIYSN